MGAGFPLVAEDEAPMIGQRISDRRLSAADCRTPRPYVVPGNLALLATSRANSPQAQHEASINCGGSEHE